MKRFSTSALACAVKSKRFLHETFQKPSELHSPRRIQTQRSGTGIRKSRKVVYEAEGVTDGKIRNVMYSSDGNLVQIDGGLSTKCSQE
jgi:hypothetical protein